MPHFRSAATLMAAAFTLSLAACGSGAEEGVTTASSATPEASSPSTSPTAEASSSAQVAEGDFTPEGAQLAVGDSALVPCGVNKGGMAEVTITVTSIDMGAPEDLAPLNLGDRAAGMTPYYVRMTVVGGTGSEALPYQSFGDIDGLLGDGSRAGSLIVMGDFAQCDGGSFPKDFAAGSSFETCVPFLAAGDAAVTGAQWQDDYGDGAYQDAQTAVTWTS